MQEIRESHFPLLSSGRGIDRVPAEIAEEAYKEYVARHGSSQSLYRIGERGGFGTFEIIQLLYQRIRRLDRELHDTTYTGPNRRTSY